MCIRSEFNQCEFQCGLNAHRVWVTPSVPQRDSYGNTQLCCFQRVQDGFRTKGPCQVMQCLVLILGCSQLASFQEFGISYIYKYWKDGLSNILWEGAFMTEFLFFALSSCTVVLAPWVFANGAMLMFRLFVCRYWVIVNYQTAPSSFLCHQHSFWSHFHSNFAGCPLLFPSVTLFLSSQLPSFSLCCSILPSFLPQARCHPFLDTVLLFDGYSIVRVLFTQVGVSLHISIGNQGGVPQLHILLWAQNQHRFWFHWGRGPLKVPGAVTFMVFQPFDVGSWAFIVITVKLALMAILKTVPQNPKPVLSKDITPPNCEVKPRVLQVPSRVTVMSMFSSQGLPASWYRSFAACL